MLTSAQAAKALLRWSPASAPITWRQLAPAVGVASPAAAKRLADELHMRRGLTASAEMYEYHRALEHRDWPPPLPLVQASMQELLSGRRAPRQRDASGPLVVRPARDGERYRTWNYGRRRARHEGDPGDPRATVGARTYEAGGPYLVLVAHEGQRLVGSTVFYFVDTLDEEQTDINEIVGPGAVGPFFARGDYRWGGHVIVMDSMWVALDRRRAGIATAMAAEVAAIGVPGYGAFRDPWFGAFFLHRWPPVTPVERGSYWPWWAQYIEAYEWAGEDDSEQAELRVTVWVSDEERADFRMAWESRDASPAAHLACVLGPDDSVRGDLDQGSWTVDVDSVQMDKAADGWRMTGRATVTYMAEPLFTRADLNRYLAAPFAELEPVEELRDALAATVIAAVCGRDPDRIRIESWALADR